MTKRTIKPDLLHILPIVLLTACANVQLPDKTSIIPPNEDAKIVSDEQILTKASALFGFSSDGRSQDTRFVLHPQKKLNGKHGESRGINLFVLGGTLIPGILSIDEIDFSEHHRTDEGLEMTVASRSTYVGIPPVCRNSKALLRVKNGRAELSFDNFYCNWMVVGNVIVGIKMELVKITDQEAEGAYTVRVNGTANGIGRGLFVMQRQASFKPQKQP